jgi:AcrR family transcriptional regulator
MPNPTWDKLPAARRDRVLRAAMAEFGRHGYSGGSLNVIAREAGVAKGSLFQYFRDKADFYAHVAEQTSLTIYAAMLPHLDGLAPDQDFLDSFSGAVDAWMDYMAAHPLERSVTAATMLELDPQVRAAVRQPVHALYAQGIRPLLERAVAAGQLPPGTDVDALLALLIQLLAHLALAPFEPGLDAGVPLYRASRRTRSASARRLLTTLLAPTPVGARR